MSKGQDTRDQILRQALSQATQVGLESLTIGQLARNMGMSKSGLFAHFGSKTGLQIAILQTAAVLFVDTVVKPAVREPRGEPRVRALFERWLGWASRASLEGGCIFVATAAEFDDRPGPVRDAVVGALEDMRDTLRRAARVAVEAGDFRSDLEVDQFAFEWHGILHAHHLYSRLLEDRQAALYARRSFDELLARARA